MLGYPHTAVAAGGEDPRGGALHSGPRGGFPGRPRAPCLCSQQGLWQTLDTVQLSQAHQCGNEGASGAAAQRSGKG